MGEYTFEDKRKENSNAYCRWSEQEEDLLIKLLNAEKSIDQISLELKRSTSAIISRLQKLEYEFEKDKSGYYNEIAKWAKDYLNDILVDEKVTYMQIADLIKELMNAIQEPRISREEILDKKDSVYKLESDNYDEFSDFGSGSHSKYNHPEYDDDTIDSAFEGDPSLVWNID